MEAIILGWRVVFAKAAAASSSAARSDHDAREAEKAFKKRSTTFECQRNELCVSEKRTLYHSQGKNQGKIRPIRPLHTQMLKAEIERTIYHFLVSVRENERGTRRQQQGHRRGACRSRRGEGSSNSRGAFLRPEVGKDETPALYV